MVKIHPLIPICGKNLPRLLHTRHTDQQLEIDSPLSPLLRVPDVEVSTPDSVSAPFVFRVSPFGGGRVSCSSFWRGAAFRVSALAGGCVTCYSRARGTHTLTSCSSQPWPPLPLDQAAALVIPLKRLGRKCAMPVAVIGTLTRCFSIY